MIQTSLDELHDIMAAPPASWWPLAPGWYVLALGGLALFVWIAWRACRAWKASAYRRNALAELGSLAESQTTAALRALPELLKRTALAAWPREELAGLTGMKWLAFLDRTGKTREFSKGKGALLIEISYGSNKTFESIPEQDRAQLFSLAEDWIEHHVHDKDHARFAG